MYRIVRSPEEATDWIASYYSTYHSVRQGGNRLVVRLEKELSDEHVSILDKKFWDLLAWGKISKTSALRLGFASRYAFRRRASGDPGGTGAWTYTST